MTLVKLLLDRGADLEAKNGSGSTALEAAFEKALVFGHEEIARYFLDMGADVKTVSPSGRLPLACAVNCSPAFVQTLLERGADVNGRAVHGTTALLVCARTGAPETSRLLLDRGADVHARDERGWTALTEAVWNDHLQVATILLDRGADPNAADNLGWTALMQAAWKGRAEAVNLLIARGAAIHAKDASGKTAFMRAVEMGHRNVASVLLDKGADVNGAQPDGWTPVIAAVTRQDRDMVVFLRKRGATMTVAAAVLLGDDPEMQRLVREAATKSTQIADAPMALLIAARNGREDMVTFLLDQCPDIDIKDSCCDAALLSAIEEKSTGIAVALLKKGANPNAANDWQVTALHRAVIKGDLKLVRLLLEKGADVNVCTIGWHIAPLVSAARSANVEIVKALLEKGAGLNAGDNSDDLMRAAVISGNKEVLELLKARGLTPTNQTLPPQIRDNSTTTDTIKEKIP